MNDDPMTIQDLKRIPPKAPPGTVACGECGSLVGEPVRHREWHRLLAR